MFVFLAGEVSLSRSIKTESVSGYDLSIYVYDGRNSVGPTTLTIRVTGLYNGSLEAIYFHFYFENNTSFNKVNMSIFVQLEHIHDYMYLFNCLIGVSNILHKSRVYWTVCIISTFKVNVLKLKYNQIM